MESLIALTGVFFGSLLWDVLFGDGIQNDDYFEAMTAGLLAAAIQRGLSLLHRKKDN
jgi:hypothetical protein